MLLAHDCFRMISSADNALVVGAIDVSLDDAGGRPPAGPDPGDTVRLPVVDRPIGRALLGALR
ncbi:MAG: hypothetical protein H6712_32275 [Myxococcales bacterium]|nr:hypothetical protein [Myxococcales bacterium]MCB9718572.1 hypothetical protein [Myxococcales bacterium]